MRPNFILQLTHVFALALAAPKISTVPLLITNRCNNTIWPGIATQAGNGPGNQGFELDSGATQNLTVGTNWNGRVWGRTNCTFDSKGSGHCGTGDCGGILNCTGIGAVATLAEFNLPAYMNQSFYDISLVDGYNLPLAIQAILSSRSTARPPANETNPSCVGSAQELAPVGFNPYSNSQHLFLNTSSQAPLPFESKMTASDVSKWCPSDLEMNPIKGSRPAFDPCLSACSKYNKPNYCCAGKKYNSAKKCGPNYYSKAAKMVCPDAYSYAFDDSSSTFTAPTGTGFEIIFCPGGRSTIIRKTLNPSGAHTLAPSLGALMIASAFTVWLTGLR